MHHDSPLPEHTSPIDQADPIEAIRYKMEIAGLKQSDLAELLESASRASEILNRKRALTTEIVDKISRQDAYRWKSRCADHRTLSP